MAWELEIVEQGWSCLLQATSLVLLPAMQFVLDTNWQTIVLLIVVIIGVLLGPYELLMVIGRMWGQRRRDRIARGEDVRPKKLPWDEED